jgi:hypothetical protein
MTEDPQAPPAWAIKEAVRRCAVAVAGHDVDVDKDVQWGVEVLPGETEKSVVYVVRGLEMANVIGLAELTSIAQNIAAEAN